jgi:L-ascorbate metabolism protein UlaG (beta-lactamase superfamily)
VTTVTWLGHSTVLIEAGGARLLTDPVLRPRVAHLTRRVVPADPGHLAALDAVLISHVHRDHLDLPTLRAIPEGVPVVGPRGVAGLIGGRRPVNELEPGEQIEIGGTIVQATPAVHHVRRRFRTVQALGFMAGGVYFAGDTDLFGGMGALGPVDTALLPVWGWGTSLGNGGHMDPPAAAEAVEMIGPRVALPIHWGTYFPAHLGRAGHLLLRDPPHDFARLVGERDPGVRVVVPSVNERVEL